MNRLVHLFGEVTFNKYDVASKASLYLKYMQNQYRVHLQKKPNYQHPPTILEAEWKGLMVDANKKKLRKEWKTPLGLGRYEALLII